MSLLLDALKKAAREKEKLNSEKNGVDESGSENVMTSVLTSKESIEPVINEENLPESDSMELDLHVEQDNDIVVEEIADEGMSPEIDESIIYEKNNPIDTEANSAENKNIENNVEAETTQEPSEQSYSESSQDKGQAIMQSAQTPESESKINILNAPDKENKSIAEENESIADKHTDNKKTGIKNEQALSQLINKSRQSTKRRKFKNKLIMAGAMLSVFFVAATYMYIEFSYQEQAIYVFDENSRPVKIRAEMKNKKVATKAVNSEDQEKIVRPEFKQRKKMTLNKEAAPKKKNNIFIEHKKSIDPTEKIIREAYRAFKKGDYKSSGQLYQKAAINEPNNRDVLLGQAAVAVKQQRYEYAKQKYQHMRLLNPKDSIAMAGLSTVQEKLDSTQTESELKYMLREQPDSAHMYFALGTVYAQKKKWAEAQSAFFSAWSAQNTNADYAFNLAVSLDQLGKPDQAIQYYTVSLKLNDSNKASFSNETVKKRLNVLGARP